MRQRFRAMGSVREWKIGPFFHELNKQATSMCGRFVRKSTIEALIEQFDIDADIESLLEIKPEYNVAPTQPVLAVVQNGRRTIRPFRWGLIPSWAKDMTRGAKMINARTETLAEKAGFRAAFHKRRCLVIADGFYEWRREATTKTPYYFHLKTGQPFGFAGLWERWKNPQGKTVESCAIITTGANELMQPVHDRMPAIIGHKDYGYWLDGSVCDPDTLASLLRPYPAAQMDARPVGTAVNSVAAKGPELIAAV
jgi:putative SOS response-associated peptidase YedK